jgi:hypothetical protein
MKLMIQLQEGSKDEVHNIESFHIRLERSGGRIKLIKYNRCFVWRVGNRLEIEINQATREVRIEPLGVIVIGSTGYDKMCSIQGIRTM